MDKCQWALHRQHGPPLPVEMPCVNRSSRADSQSPRAE